MKKLLLLLFSILLISCGDRDNISTDVRGKFYFTHYNLYPDKSDNYISFMLFADGNSSHRREINVIWRFYTDNNDNIDCYKNMSLFIDDRILLPEMREVEFENFYGTPRIVARIKYNFQQLLEIAQSQNIKIRACSNSYTLTDKNLSKLRTAFKKWFELFLKK